MIYLRTFAIAIILIVLSFFSWRCSEDDVIINKSTSIQTDGNPCPGENQEYLTFLVEEYVKVTQYKDTPPYYEYRTLLDVTCCDCFDENCGCGSNPPETCFHCTNFTTPYHSRFEQGALVETQHYRYIGVAEWGTTRGNTLVWNLRAGSTTYYNNDSHPFDNNYYYSFSVTPDDLLPENTTITAKYGKDAYSD